MPPISPRLAPHRPLSDDIRPLPASRHTAGAARGGRRASNLSPAERRARRTIVHPADGFGFAHGSSRVCKRAKRRLDTLLFSVSHRPGAKMTIVVGTSGSGSLAANQRIAAARADATMAALRRSGFTGEIEVQLKITPPDGHDDPNDRTVRLRIHQPPMRDRFDARRALQVLMSGRRPTGRRES